MCLRAFRAMNYRRAQCRPCCSEARLSAAQLHVRSSMVYSPDADPVSANLIGTRVTGSANQLFEPWRLIERSGFPHRHYWLLDPHALSEPAGDGPQGR